MAKLLYFGVIPYLGIHEDIQDDKGYNHELHKFDNNHCSSYDAPDALYIKLCSEAYLHIDQFKDDYEKKCLGKTNCDLRLKDYYKPCMSALCFSNFNNDPLYPRTRCLQKFSRIYF